MLTLNWNHTTDESPTMPEVEIKIKLFSKITNFALLREGLKSIRKDNQLSNYMHVKYLNNYYLTLHTPK